MLTACSSDNDVLQNATQPQQTVVNRAVGFDIYTPAATGVTRAGLVGTMTTNRMQLSEGEGGGFGVYAFLTEDTKAAAGVGANADGYTSTGGQKPNFMFNEKILWNSQNLGWYYSPLKYWPNETDNDSQTTQATMEGSTPKHLDRLTFFAYAPYVPAGSGTTGITEISNNVGELNSTGVTDPTIKYVSTNTVDDVEPNNYVDLLWGVAPSGGLEYTAVNGTTVTKKEGTPLIDMIKPDVNTNMKFLFNHALARFGVSVVAAIDQVSPGGELDPNTKITINSLKITGPFGIGGELNLNNGVNANIANWTKITGGAADEPVTGSTPNLTADKYITVSSAIAENLKYVGPHTWNSYSAQPVVGVTPARQDLLKPSTKWFNKLAAAPTYNPGKIYYSDKGTTELHATHTATATDVANKYYKLNSGHYVLITASTDEVQTPNYPNVDTEWVTLTAKKEYTADPSEASNVYYTYDGTDFTYAATPSWDGTKYYTVTATPVSTSEIIKKNDAEHGFTYSGSNFYEAERNYLYVVPTNNVSKNATAAPNEEDLRTITVQIEYYITTKDEKVGNGYTQTKNVITKKVVLPSLANSKSYNLNLVLGLTSVKIEAEVDDWKVINSQVDLPQNTAE